MKRSKRYQQLVKKVDRFRPIKLEEAIHLVKENAKANFDESIEVAIRLGIDPKQSDQHIRGTVLLPHGTGRKVRLLVLTKGEKEKEAIEAGADFVGAEEYLEKISSGWTDVDAIVATPDLMGQVGKLGKILGTRGLMPNPKSGTVTFEVAKAVKEIKAGKIEYRVDKAGNLHVPVGKASFSEEKLKENILSLLSEVLRVRPSSVKGPYIQNISLSSTMGPGIRLNVQEIMGLLR